jgi:hypothetical protein
VKRIFLLFCLLLLAFSGCRQSQQSATSQADVRIELSTDPTPPETGDGTLLVTVTNPDGSPADVVRVEVRGDMNHAGMQPVFSGADLPEDGVYRVPFNWTMGGEWLLDVSVLLEDGSAAAQRFEVAVEP